MVIFMREDFIKEENFFTEEVKELNVYEEIEMSKKKLQSYYQNMNYVEDGMVDYYVYQIKAEQAKFGFLLNEIKNKESNENKLE